MRLGIFGGSFDPVHYGHLLLAETCREQMCLDRVLFVPNAVSPHKDHATTSPEARVEMLKLALGGHPAMHVSTLEIERGGVSYTVDTLTRLQQEYQNEKLFLLMGADSLEELPTWREPERICHLAVPLVVRRAGAAEPDIGKLAQLVDPERLGEIRECQVTMPVMELSSTDIRQRVAAEKSIQYRLPRGVEMYIRGNGLYSAGNRIGADE